MSKQNDKRNRLIEAADELIYQQTFHVTTLADIAAKAEVPLGNVYYYFKTKEDILKSVVQKRASALQAQFTHWEQRLPNAKDRLRAFIGDNVETSQMTAKFGSEIGTLCQELGKCTGEFSTLMAELMHTTLAWMEMQFKTLGKSEQATILAHYFLASLQGISLLTLTFKDPTLTHRQSKYLEQWLETV